MYRLVRAKEIKCFLQKPLNLAQKRKIGVENCNNEMLLVQNQKIKK